MVPPFDKYLTLFLQSSVSTYTHIEGVRKSNIIYQSFFVKHVYIILFWYIQKNYWLLFIFNVSYWDKSKTAVSFVVIFQ